MSLTKEQLMAAAMVANGISYPKVGKQIGLSRSTIARWAGEEEFKAEVERRKAEAFAPIAEKLEQMQQEKADEFLGAIKEYREARISIYKQKLSRGLKGLKKTTERFEDLPSEAIAPNNIAQLLNSFDSMVESAMGGWGELLALDELLKRLEGDGPKE